MTSPVVEFTPYSSALPFFEGSLDWVSSEDDRERVQAYELYKKMYWNEPGWCKLMKRGDDDEQVKDIYIPSARRIIEATNRFLGLGFEYAIEGTNAALDKTLKSLYAREAIPSKFSRMKRELQYQGDCLWHVTADDTKEQGTRLSILPLDPSSWFPIFDEDDDTKIVGCHLVDIIEDPADDKKVIAKRQTYRKVVSPLGAREVTSELTYWEQDAWDDRNLEPGELKQLHPVELEEKAPESIEANGLKIPTLPVYHFKNLVWGVHPYGISDLRGFETAIAAVNQSLTDQDLTLVMQGLGVYWTNAGPPKDGEGNDTTLEVSPGHILEVPDGNTIGRLNGVSSVAPFIEHMQFILDKVDGSRGISDAATGTIDVTTAESGIALFLRLMPILSANKEKEQDIAAVMKQLHFDILNYWMPAYEQDSTGVGAVVDIVFADATPVNRKAKIEEIILLFTSGLLTVDMAIEEMTKLGYKFPAGAAEKLLSEAAARVKASTPVDTFGSRAEDESGGSNNPSETGGGEA